MFMNQITSLKKLTYYLITFVNTPNDLCFPETKNYLKELSELRCSSIIHSEFFYQLAQISHNLRSLTIEFVSDVLDELKRLILLQNNLINLNLLAYEGNNWKNIIPALAKHSNTLKKIHLYSNNNDLPLSFISLFSNLQDIRFSFFGGTFGQNNEHLNLCIPKFCPNLKSFLAIFNNNELHALIMMLNRCNDLENIEIWCGKRFLNEKDVLDVIIKYSQKNFYKLKINNDSPSELSPNDLETFFIEWKNKKPNIIFTLITNKNNYNGLDLDENNIRIIKKYEDLGIVRTKEFCDEEDEDY
ncbi:uncharacterized protein OCT59_011883 [Rhizophagus irregularis]|nr:hypothetical protein OCT59_011883 [Rhizophagus irregularis]